MRQSKSANKMAFSLDSHYSYRVGAYKRKDLDGGQIHSTPTVSTKFFFKIRFRMSKD